MAFTRGRCTNFDYCSVAESRRDIEVRVGDDFVCPECGKPLKAPQINARAASPLGPILLGLGVLVLVSGGVFLGMQMGSLNSGPARPPAGPQTPVAPARLAAIAVPPQAAPVARVAAASGPAENVLARVRGAPDLAASVMAPLAAAYLSEIGDTAITTAQDGPQTRVSGLRGGLREAIVIIGDGVTAGFDALAAGHADLVVTPRRVTASEQTALSRLGDMTSPTAEHVLAMGAQAVVVNPSNQTVSLTRGQIRDLFAGGFTDWASLGGPTGLVNVYALRPAGQRGPGQGDIAPEAAPGAHWVADEPAIARAVMADLHGVGLVDTAAIGGARALPVAETGAAAVSPTDRVALAANDYPLSYRVYLYNGPKEEAGFAQRFAAYALSAQGQAVIDQHGLVAPRARPAPAAQAAMAAPLSQLDRLRGYVAGSKKLGIVFHFTPNSTALDQYGERDLDRVTNYLVSLHEGGEHLLLAGFADNQGEPATNVEVSKKRADEVAALFVERGLKPGGVEGFGAELPVADNASEVGRLRNRRVEVYIKP